MGGISTCVCVEGWGGISTVCVGGWGGISTYVCWGVGWDKYMCVCWGVGNRHMCVLGSVGGIGTCVCVGGGGINTCVCVEGWGGISIGYTMRMRGYRIYTTEGEARGRVYSMTPDGEDDRSERLGNSDGKHGSSDGGNDSGKRVATTTAHFGPLTSSENVKRG